MTPRTLHLHNYYLLKQNVLQYLLLIFSRKNILDKMDNLDKIKIFLTFLQFRVGILTFFANNIVGG